LGCSASLAYDGLGSGGCTVAGEALADQQSWCHTGEK
jgi:hypothetical protein